MIAEIFAFWIPLGLLVLWFGICFRLMYIMVKTDSIKDKSYARQFVEWVSDLMRPNA